ncbi:MAG TPA: hypothetical protein DD640_07055 [Clostridiales bacterium]|nr:hypothetical protein [Clostridiales bacterium]
MGQEMDNTRASDPMAFDAKYHTAQISSIIHAYETGRSADVDGSEARKSVELIGSIYQSAQIGQEVVL